MRTAWLALLLAACVRTSAVDCGDAVCASGQICVHATADVTVCAPQGARDACAGAGLSDGETCGDHGRCYDGACVPIECGDRLVDPQLEQCDDGNNVPGDTCSADCRSNETCGNGIVDPILGENCDDANAIGHDGCSSVCTLETARWTRVNVGTPPLGVAVGMAYLPVRGRVVGLFADGAKRSTWQWDGTGWQELATTVAPTDRTDFGTVADPRRDALVVVGGSGGGILSGSLSDLWELRGDRWSFVTGSLVGRSSPAIAYDARRQRVMVFGGRSNGTFVLPLDDFYAWDGAVATPVAQTNIPAARWSAAMVYDPVRDELVLFGGMANNGPRSDTWTFKAGAWTQRMVAGPSPRFDARMIVDSIGVVLYGGNDGNKALDDAWRWNGTAWTSLGVQEPGPRSAHGFVYDSARRRAVLFGGSPSVQTWEWDGSGKWQEAGTVTPTVGELAASAFDPLRHQGIVFTPTNTYAMRDGSWEPLTGSPTPSRTAAALVFDTTRDRAVLFGGSPVNGGPFADTMVMTPGPNAAWAALPVATSPPGRSATAFAFDSDRGVAVLFGGNDGITLVDDTWELDTTWHERIVTERPPHREYPAMGYDPIRHQTILFGGNGFGGRVSDTWAWNGTAWTELHPTGRTPAPRSHATLTWNPARRRLTLVGGNTDVVGVIDDAWEWTGTAWQEIQPVVTPGARAGHVSVAASDTSGLYIVAGTSGASLLQDQWLLSWSEPDRIYERCVARQDLDGDGAFGCDDPDCWWACTPLCTPGVSCPSSAPRCGDGAVSPAETCQLCTADVAACSLCGDLACEPPETSTTCPGDCP